MVYTRERLHNALRIYREAKKSHSQPDQSCLSLSRHLRHKYEFRRAQLQARSRVKLWRDDASSNDDEEYNPAGGRKKKPTAINTRPKNTLKRRSSNEDVNALFKKKKKLKDETSKEIGSKEDRQRCTAAFITLCPNPDMSKTFLQQLAGIHNVMIVGQECIGSGGGREERFDANDYEPEFARMAEENHIRKQAKSYFAKLDQECNEIDNEGGRALRSRMIDTSLIPNKMSCQACKTARKRCYFSKNASNETCSRCLTEGTDCVFPEPEMVAESSNEAYTAHETQGQPHSPDHMIYTNKTESRSLPVNLQSPGSPAQRDPDRYAEAEPIKARTSTFGTGTAQISLPSPPLTPESQVSRKLTITTHWAHPIDFKWIPKPDSRPCSFEENIVFGIFGHGKRCVEVIQLPGSKSYEELGNGHRADNKPPTKMCVACALKRLQISRCRRHMIDQIPGCSQDKPNWREYLSQVMRPHAVPLKKAMYHICSLCLAPAFWRCCAKQNLDKFGNRQPASMRELGCSLLLCALCKRVVESRDGRLQKVVIEQELRDKMKCESRADLEFLFPGSLLHQAYGL